MLLHTVVPLSKRLPFKKGELSAKLTEGFRHGLRRATVPQFNMVASLRAQSALAMFPVSLGLLRPVSATGGGLRAPLWFQREAFGQCYSPAAYHYPKGSPA